jgi:hypothetical protein
MCKRSTNSASGDRSACKTHNVILPVTWAFGNDGGIFAFNAPFEGSVPGAGVHVDNIVGVAADVTTGGYWVVGSNGGIYAFNAPFEGSVPSESIRVNNIVGITGG